MLKIAICDDDKSICSQLEQIILDYKKLNAVDINIEVFYSGESLIDFIENEHSFDLIFLDIELGTTTGIKVGQVLRKELNDHVTKIVFITSKDGYDRELFDLQPFNFLAKPIDKRKLIQCIELVVEMLNIDILMFEYKKSYDFIKVEIKKIIYFERVNKKVKIVTTMGEDFFYEPLEKIKDRLPKKFVEPHKSFLVNFDKVIKSSKESIVMCTGQEIPVSQRNLKIIRNHIIENEREK